MPICDDYWNMNSAKIVCRSLGKPSRVVAKSVKNSLWGKTGNKYALYNVKCNGYENHITECSSYNGYCDYNKGAGVVCFDPDSVKLSEGNKGFVMAIGRPIVNSVWGMKESQVVCNQLFGKFFSLKNVPVLASSLELYRSPMPCVISKVNCTGKEKGIEHCSYNVISDCPSVKTVPKVSCAACTEADFISMIDSLKFDGSRKEQYDAVVKQLDRLQKKCGSWDCSGREGKFTYPEFCHVKNFFEDWKSILEPTKDKKVVFLENKFDYSKLLEQNFLKQKFSSLRNDISSLSDQMSDFQKSLAHHFKVLAQFNEMKIKADLKSLTMGWSKSIDDLRDKKSVFQEQLFKIINFAAGVIAADVAEKIADLVLQIVDMVLSPSPSGIVSIHDTAAALSKLAFKSVKLNNIKREISVVQTVLTEIQIGIKGNQETYSAIDNFFTEAQDGEFSLDTARKFLKHYKGFKGAIDAVQIAKLEESLTYIVEETCNIIEDSSSVIGNAVAAGEVGTGNPCLGAKQSIKTIIVTFNGLGEDQNIVIKGYAALAKAKLSETSANNLASVLKNNLNDKLYRALAKARSSFQLREQKMNLIEEACNEIAYLNYGIEESFCTQLKSNIDSDMSKLIGYKRKDMCTDRMMIQKMIFLPTQSLNETSSQKLNIGQLMRKSNDTYWKTSGSASLEIPDEEWLVDNGWINKGDKGPFYVKNLEIFLPPTHYQDGTEYVVETEVNFLKSYVNNVNYIFPAQIMNMEMNYYENVNYQSSSSCREKLAPYAHCANQVSPVCIFGQKKIDGPFYPPITSSWKFDIKSSYQLPHINSKTPFFLRARIQLCSNGSPFSKYLFMADQDCCHGDKYYDPVEMMAAVRNNPCKSCPEDSIPRLEGYFCEECPIGQQPNKDLYGCEVCPHGAFKNSTGPMTCKISTNGSTSKNSTGVSSNGTRPVVSGIYFIGMVYSLLILF